MFAKDYDGDVNSMTTEWVHEWEIYCTDDEGLIATA